VVCFEGLFSLGRKSKDKQKKKEKKQKNKKRSENDSMKLSFVKKKWNEKKTGDEWIVNTEVHKWSYFSVVDAKDKDVRKALSHFENQRTQKPCLPWNG
jgi:hypothetical protein